MLDTSTVPRPPACGPVQYEAVVGGVPPRAGGQVPGVQQQALPAPGRSSSSPVSMVDSVHGGQCGALPDRLPVPHHLAGRVAVHAAAEGRHAAPGHLGGVGRHPGAVCRGTVIRRLYILHPLAGVAIRPAAQSAIELSF